MKKSIHFLFYALFFTQLLTSCSTTKNITTNVQEAPTSKIDSIPFEITEANNIKFQVILNGVDHLDFYFDTGGTGIVVRKDAIKNQTTLLQNEADDFELETYEPLKNLSTMKLGSVVYDSLTIWPVPVGPEDMAGHFGWDLFENKVVELDYDKKVMIVHSAPIAIPDGYSKMDIENTHTLFCIQGAAVVDGKTYTNRYLFDTGFQRAVVLDKDLRHEDNFPTDLEVIKESKLKNSEGTLFVNQVIIADQFCFNGACATEVPAQLFNAPNPARFKTHILGGELLKRFNTIMDFQNNKIYLKPNSLMSLPYIDAS